MTGVVIGHSLTHSLTFSSRLHSSSTTPCQWQEGSRMDPVTSSPLLLRSSCRPRPHSYSHSHSHSLPWGCSSAMTCADIGPAFRKVVANYQPRGCCSCRSGSRCSCACRTFAARRSSCERVPSRPTGAVDGVGEGVIVAVAVAVAETRSRQAAEGRSVPGR